MRVLVVGGAGYIGAHMAKMLAGNSCEVVVLDNLSTGYRDAVLWGAFEEAALSDVPRLDAIFAKYGFDAVLHFAAASIVPDSVREPLRYYRNNVADTISLLEAMQRHGVRRFIFSSTAAVFGEPRQPYIDEQHPLQPVNPYGASKLAVERILQDCAPAYGLSSAVLRYFNAAGADASGAIGESHRPETHLIPRLLDVALGRTAAAEIYGTDYPTPDGTCVRDYIHVDDLCRAHLLALDHLGGNPGFHAFNLGNGKGYSVRQVLAAVEAVTGVKLNVKYAPRRPGDPAQLVAASGKARTVLGWEPAIPGIETIVASAWNWQRAARY